MALSSEILEELHLPELISKLVEEKLNTDSLLQCTDDDLKRIGVIALGDRMQLRDACQKNARNNSIVSLEQAQRSFRDTPWASSIPTRQATSARSSVMKERSVLFEPYLGKRDRSKKNNHEKTVNF